MSKRSYNTVFSDENDSTRNTEESDVHKVDLLFGQHRLFAVPKVPEERLKNLYSGKDQVLNVEDYLSLVRYELEVTESFGKVKRDETKVEKLQHESSKMDLFQDLDDNVHNWIVEILSLYDDKKIKYSEMVSKYGDADGLGTPELPSSVLNWKQLVVNNEPDLLIIGHLEFSQRFKLLSLFQRWCSKKINSNFVKWIYVIMMIVPEVITYDEMAILRLLLKKLARLLILKAVEDQATFVCYLWVVVIAAERYGQRDLYELDIETGPSSGLSSGPGNITESPASASASAPAPDQTTTEPATDSK